MRIVIRAAIVLLVLVLAVLAAGQAGLFSGHPPADLGVREGRLKAPSSTPNSVSSQADLQVGHPMRAYARIEPLGLVGGDGPATIARIAQAVAAMPGARVVEARPDYLHVQFTTRWLKFIDDAEFWFDPAAGVVHLRSASRLGRKDYGVNRERIEALRRVLAGA